MNLKTIWIVERKQLIRLRPTDGDDVALVGDLVEVGEGGLTMDLKKERKDI
jgi:hypothetical protein